MEVEIKKTSKEWYRYYNKVEGIVIADYAGWEGDLKYLFEVEKITQDEFLNRLAKSAYTKA